MGNHHEPFLSLGPVDWADVPQDDLGPFLHDIFAGAHTVIDSIPSSTSPSSIKPRARANTDSARPDGTVLAAAAAASPSQDDPEAAEQARKLQQEWKEVKVNPRENPLGIRVYKLASKDGGGAWFARRSVHEGLTFEQWKAGLDREFVESMAVQGGPGSGSIRGIGADKRVEDHVVPDAGNVQVYQLSAQFPGPTSPRDFVTLFLTSASHSTASDPDQPRPLRQYTIVSKPCLHPECPPRHGIIRGQYESVELIREIPAENLASKRSLSSVDLSSGENVEPGVPKGSSSEQGDSPPTAIEWLMVTRSDPGGSVPRFMIEKGTPPGIVNDAGKFLNWVTRKSTNDSLPQQEEGTAQETEVSSGAANGVKALAVPRPPAEGGRPSDQGQDYHQGEGADDDGSWGSSGVWAMITGAFGAATSVVSGGLLRRQFSTAEGEVSGSEDYSPRDEEAKDDTSSPSETSSIHSFASALEKKSTHDGGAGSVHESLSEDKSQGSQSQLKELRRLEERRRKLDEKSRKMVERIERQRQGGKEKDAAAIAKAREKHERELAKHEAKYKRELRKIEEKQAHEQRKAEERRRKAIEREEKSNLTLEVEKLKIERDLALKQVELLTSQVGELQAQNTSLVARLGKLVGIERSESMSTTSSKKG